MNFSSARKQITIDNKRLSYLDIGTGPVLLFGHSYLWDSRMWTPQIEHLSKQYRCIVPELWGHGESDPLPDSTHSLRDISQQMLQLMDSLSIDDFAVIGLSVGGMWGAELALAAPTRVKALVMMNCFIGYEPEVARAKYYAMLDIIKEAQGVPAPLIEQIAPLYFAKNVAQDNPELFNTFKQSLADIDSGRIESICRLGKIIFGRRDTLDDVEQLTLPCLIMTGLEDTVRPVLESYLMHDAINGSEFINIPNAGHISSLEQPDFVNQQLSQFLTKHLDK
ncbi:alpha/beta fold hydrolase [Shewanella violacea]|uniref:Hydrolase, alpha/beta fold family n=1 Tax=Shewanella violacea (strain JCM 10179 / CIP 106290 / LMG 19151 / DSS12) TaxID=637905 RepID=D4ZJQ3_SHEVD|nr:alpha/beta fold hydrolase [Shewanella violacea]BAJ01902.1 hydrolase, alpha/beta fold family [Shewanella violacea DSS12]